MEHKQGIFSSRLWRERILPGAAFFAVLFEFTFYLVRFILPEALFRPFMVVRPAAFVCEGLLLLGVILSKEKKRSFLLFNVCWLLLTRCILGDLGPTAQFSIQWAIVLVCFFHCFAFLSKKQRDLLYALITLELTCMIGLWALLGIATAITGHPIAGFKSVGFSAEYEGTEPILVFISFFGIHRNVSATYFVCATGMLLYHCRKTNTSFWKGLTLLFLPLACCAIAIQHSRSNYLAFAALLGLVLVSSLTQLRRWPRGLAGNAAAICTLVLSVALVFISMGAVSNGISALSQTMQETPSAETHAGGEPATESEAPAELSDSAGAHTGGELNAENEVPAEVSDSRNTFEHYRTLTGRTDIWRAGLQTIRENPSIALIGLPVESIMTRVVQILDMPYAHTHMHNALMQQLMMSGVPGMVIYCLFFLSLLKRIALDVRHRWKKKVAIQPLEALLLVLLVYGMFEPLLYKSVKISSLLFCLSAGLLVTELEDPS